MRLFLIYILNTKRLIRLGFFYSHFVIFKCFKYLLVKIFAYFGLIEDYVAEFSNTSTLVNRFHKKYQRIPNHDFIQVILVFCLFSFNNERL